MREGSSLVVQSESGNITPVEASWLIFSDDSHAGFLGLARETLLLWHGMGRSEEIHGRIQRRELESHLTRSIVRVALHPDRHTLVDLHETYLKDKGSGDNKNDLEYTAEYDSLVCGYKLQ